MEIHLILQLQINQSKHTKMEINSIKNKVVSIVSSKTTLEERLQAICVLLESTVSYYDWVGFYFKNGDKNELKLAQYTGEETEHTIIPFGKGICGQVAISNENFVVQDVSEQDNYISCGWKVKSEIVIPIFVNDKNIGQIDIDSHTTNVFNLEDEELLEFICLKVAEIL
jgi:L-methionine (R)-S-oxide reductase